MFIEKRFIRLADTAWARGSNGVRMSWYLLGPRWMLKAWKVLGELLVFSPSTLEG